MYGELKLLRNYSRLKRLAAKAVILLTLLAFSPLADAQVTQWTDEEGVTHFGNDPRPRDLEKQAQLSKMADVIETAKRNGIILSHGPTPGFRWVYQIVVGKPFYNLTFDLKSKLIAGIWAYAYMSDKEPPLLDVDVVDGYSGKRIGKFAPRNLELLLY